MVAVESYSAGLLIYGFGVTRSDRSWGIPLSSSSSSTASFTFRKCHGSTSPPTTNAELPTNVYQFHFGERIVRHCGSSLYQTDLSPTPPLASHSLSTKLSQRESLNPRRALPRFLTLYPPDRRTEPALLPSPNRRTEPALLSSPGSTRLLTHCCSHIAVRHLYRRVPSIFYAEVGQQRLVMGFISPSTFNCIILSPVSQPTKKWGILVYLAIFLEIFGGFTRVFTETNLHSLDHFFCSKSIISFHLPVGSPGPSLPSFTSFLRSVLPPILWRCLSISITVLLSCGAVCSGPEDAAGFVSTSFRGADWMSTSQFKVTISLLSDHVGKATLTHSSTVLSSLSSSSFEDLSFLSYIVVVYIFNQRGWTIPSIICNQAS
ncbi:hypothetical protein N665_0846s0016 [Sinapis alba]|nr:hypothetical protein N665_0846s0016 [Sinapis alba]